MLYFVKYRRVKDTTWTKPCTVVARSASKAKAKLRKVLNLPATTQFQLTSRGWTKDEPKRQR